MRALLIALAVALGLTPAAARTAPQPPRLLSQTGLYSAPGVVDARHLAYAPQYPLWTDGAAKARWLHLPAGAAIDGRDEDGWVFPVGTKAWKEFAFQGRKVETRLLWKTGPKTWAFASYAWNADQSDAVLVPEAGLPDAAEVAPGVRHSIPSRSDCRSCHGQEQVEVLGFTALQLSPDRDPGAIHGEPLQPGMVTLRDLVARRLRRPGLSRGQLRRLPPGGPAPPGPGPGLPPHLPHRAGGRGARPPHHPPPPQPLPGLRHRREPAPPARRPRPQHPAPQDGLPAAHLPDAPPGLGPGGPGGRDPPKPLDR